MHLTARKMIFNANYEEKLTESFQNKRNWVQLGSIGRLRHFPSVCDVSRNVEKCREMSKNVEFCQSRCWGGPSWGGMDPQAAGPIKRLVAPCPPPTVDKFSTRKILFAIFVRYSAKISPPPIMRVVGMAPHPPMKSCRRETVLYVS